MLSNLSKSIVLEATTQFTSRTLSTTGIGLLENGHLASFPQFGLPKIQGCIHVITSSRFLFCRNYQTYSFLSSRLKRYVTLKILKANISSNSRERSILLHLSKADTHHPGKNHVLQLLDQFKHEGPNGLHLCLVFPVMMSDGEAMTIREKPRYPGYVREIAKQILLGLNYLHDQGLIHGGMYLRDRMPKMIILIHK
jgi:serine/threonine protein kinase